MNAQVVALKFMKSQESFLNERSILTELSEVMHGTRYEDYFLQLFHSYNGSDENDDEDHFEEMLSISITRSIRIVWCSRLQKPISKHFYRSVIYSLRTGRKSNESLHMFFLLLVSYTAETLCMEISNLRIS